MTLVTGCTYTVIPPEVTTESSYQNPLPVFVDGDVVVESCADPSILSPTENGERIWTMYCTTDPLHGADRNRVGHYNFRLIPIFQSTDLVHWHYVGDVFAERPDWVAPDAGLWAPDIHFLNGQYVLYYSASETSLPGGGRAIGAATSQSPTGPWTDSGAPVIEPHAAPCCPGERRWTIDSSVIVDDEGQHYIYYGSYVGGISVRKLSPDGLHSDPATEVLITIPNRYEAAHVIRRAGFYYLFVSATDCCRGPLTGYTVFAGRAQGPLGPFVDRDGVSLLSSRVGGTPVLSMNGNRWVGPGHNTVVQDLAGQDWLVYHAIDRHDPYFTGYPGFTKRPVLLDRLDWIDGWPTVRAGHWVSDTPQPAPTLDAGEGKAEPEFVPLVPDEPGELLADFSDEFDAATLAAQWSWVRQPTDAEVGLAQGLFRFETQDGDLHENSNNASVLIMPAPEGDYLVETRVRLDVPAQGCCYNYVQAGLVIYEDDNNYIKLTHASIWETRQTEFAKELFPVPVAYPRYGNSVIGPPGEWTSLRIVRRACGDEECYTGYSRRDGDEWVRGATWTHQLGNTPQIGLVSMGGTGYTAHFDYVRVSRLKEIEP